jgi:hypothetical protein
VEPRQRVGYDEALARLRTVPALYEITGDRWLQRQMAKPVEQYSLLAGWLTSSDFDWQYIYAAPTASLEVAATKLSTGLPNNLWPKLRKKIRAESIRSQSKGTLAELALAVFLVDQGISFDMEQPIVPDSNTNVDFSVNLGLPDQVHIEVQWVTDTVEYSDVIAAYHHIPSGDPFPKYVKAVRERVSSKLPKFSATAITLVALDTTDMAASRDQYTSPMYEALCHIFATEISTALAPWECDMRERVEGVIWYASKPKKEIYPVERGYILNEHSPHFANPSLKRWVEIWSAEQ